MDTKSKLYIKEITPTHKGLFVCNNFEQDDVIHTLTGICYEQPSQTTIVICDGKIVALQPIQEHTEITFDYNKNESIMACPFVDQLTKKKVVGKCQ